MSLELGLPYNLNTKPDEFTYEPINKLHEHILVETIILE